MEGVDGDIATVGEGGRSSSSSSSNGSSSGGPSGGRARSAEPIITPLRSFDSTQQAQLQRLPLPHQQHGHDHAASHPHDSLFLTGHLLQQQQLLLQQHAFEYQQLQQQQQQQLHQQLNSQQQHPSLAHNQPALHLLQLQRLQQLQLQQQLQQQQQQQQHLPLPAQPLHTAQYQHHHHLQQQQQQQQKQSFSSCRYTSWTGAGATGRPSSALLEIANEEDETWDSYDDYLESAQFHAAPRQTMPSARDADVDGCANPFSWTELATSCRQLDDANIRIAEIDLTFVEAGDSDPDAAVRYSFKLEGQGSGGSGSCDGSSSILQPVHMQSHHHAHAEPLGASQRFSSSSSFTGLQSSFSSSCKSLTHSLSGGSGSFPLASPRDHLPTLSSSAAAFGSGAAAAAAVAPPKDLHLLPSAAVPPAATAGTPPLRTVLTGKRHQLDAVGSPVRHHGSPRLQQAAACAANGSSSPFNSGSPIKVSLDGASWAPAVPAVPRPSLLRPSAAAAGAMSTSVPERSMSTPVKFGSVEDMEAMGSESFRASAGARGISTSATNSPSKRSMLQVVRAVKAKCGVLFGTAPRRSAQGASGPPRPMAVSATGRSSSHF